MVRLRRERSSGVVLSEMAAGLSMCLTLLEWNCSLCSFISSRVGAQGASLCRRIFAEREIGLKPRTVGRIGAP